MRHVRTPRAARRFALASCATALIACGSDAPPGSEGAPEVERLVEFVYARYGGLCSTPDGGAICRLRVVVRDDGAWSLDGAPPRIPSSGAIPDDAASGLAAIFESGFDALTARPFTDTCPVAYDGSETSYEVHYIPTGPGAHLADAIVKEVRSCTHDLSHDGAQSVLAQIDERWETLGLPR